MQTGLDNGVAHLVRILPGHTRLMTCPLCRLDSGYFRTGHTNVPHQKCMNRMNHQRSKHQSLAASAEDVWIPFCTNTDTSYWWL